MRVSKSVLFAATLGLATAFLLFRSGLDFGYVIPNRLIRIGAIAIGGICVACTSICFQTIAGNRILTPAIMGYEGVFLLLQSTLTLVLGGHTRIVFGNSANFLISLGCMLAYSWALHRWLFKDGRRDIYFLLLLGLVLSMVMGTLAQFVQLKISPSDFGMVQSLIYATFNRAQADQLGYSALLLVGVLVVGAKTLPYLDAIALGKNRAISLGVDYPRYVRLYLILTAVLVATSTSLIGPTGFMGIFVANLTYTIAASARHRAMLPIGCAIAITIFLVAQFLVEHVFNYTTTVSILINMLGGAYFLILMVRTKGNA